MSESENDRGDVVFTKIELNTVMKRTYSYCDLLPDYCVFNVVMKAVHLKCPQIHSQDC